MKKISYFFILAIVMAGCEDPIDPHCHNCGGSGGNVPPQTTIGVFYASEVEENSFFTDGSRRVITCDNQIVFASVNYANAIEARVLTGQAVQILCEFDEDNWWVITHRKIARTGFGSCSF